MYVRSFVSTSSLMCYHIEDILYMYKILSEETFAILINAMICLHAKGVVISPTNFSCQKQVVHQSWLLLSMPASVKKRWLGLKTSGPLHMRSSHSQLWEGLSDFSALSLIAAGLAEMVDKVIKGGQQLKEVIFTCLIFV